MFYQHQHYLQEGIQCMSVFLLFQLPRNKPFVIYVIIVSVGNMLADFYVNNNII